MSGAVRFKFAERSERCSVDLDLSDDYSVDICFGYPDRDTVPENLSQRISAKYDLHRSSFRVCVGELDLAFDRFGDEPFSRLEDIAYYRYRARWEAGSLELPHRNGKRAFLVVEDEERLEPLTSVPASTRAVLDARRRRLRIDVDGQSAGATWAEIAEGAFAGLQNGQLSGLFFDGFDGPGDPGVR